MFPAEPHYWVCQVCLALYHAIWINLPPNQLTAPPFSSPKFTATNPKPTASSLNLESDLDEYSPQKTKQKMRTKALNSKATPLRKDAQSWPEVYKPQAPPDNMVTPKSNPPQNPWVYWNALEYHWGTALHD